MKLLFKQRFFSWLDSYDIYDEMGNTVYTVKGELSWGHKLQNFTDTYSLTISDPRNAIYVLMIALAIDAQKCSNNS